MEGILKQNQTTRDNILMREVLEAYGIDHRKFPKDKTAIMEALIELAGKN